MKATTITPMPRWLRSVVGACLGAIVALMPVHAFISTWGGTVIGPLWLWKSWKEILLAVMAALVAGWMITKPHNWRVLSRDVVFWLVIGFVALLSLLTIIHAGTNGFDAATAGYAMDSRYLLLFGLAYALFRFGDYDWKEIRRVAGTWLVVVGTALAIIGLMQVLVLPADFLSAFGYDKHRTIAPYVLIDENPDALRAFATMRGPNDFGAYLILPLIAALFLRRNKWFILAAITMMAGLYASGSRSAWLGVVIALAVFVGVTYKKALLTPRILVGVISVVIVLVIGLVSAISVPAIRLAIFHSSPGDSSLTEGSTDNHWRAVATGLERVVRNPFGCGAGCAGPASYYSTQPHISENYYIQIAEETGVVGLGVWISIVGIVAVRLWQRRADWFARGLFASLIGITAVGLWLHVWGDDPLSLTWWALAGITLGYYASASSKKTVL